MHVGSRRGEQRGAIMAIFAVAMVAMMGVIGLALDGGHAYINLTRLQNTLDAAALSGAKALDETNANTLEAEVAARATFSENVNNVGNSEMADAYANMNIAVEFSNSLDPFISGSAPARFVRVRVDNFDLDGWFVPVLGVDELEVASSAVAGPSPSLTRICEIAPMMVCGDPNAPAPYFGYTPGMPDVLKTASTHGHSQVGPGNFQLIRLDGLNGGADIRRAMAGDFNACIDTGNDLETEPGNTMGPVVQGLNTRLGIYKGPMKNTESEYPPDVITTEVNPPLTWDPATDEISYQGNVINDPTQATYYNYQDYKNDISQGNFTYDPITGDPPGIGAFGRRTLPVPIGDCTNATNGHGFLPLLGVLCYHLLQPVVQQGNEGHVYGEFVDDGCGVTGNPGDQPNTGPGPHIIQLYKDPDNTAA